MAALDRRAEATLEDQVYSRIVALLREQALGRAKRITDVGLAQELGVSRTPVRSALFRLATRGLLEKDPSGGWIPVRITRSDLQEIRDLKVLLRPAVVRQAAEKITPEAAAELRESIRAMEAAMVAGDMEAWRAADQQGQEVSYRVAGNKRLADFLRLLDDQWYRLRVAVETMRAHMPESLKAHRDIVEAVVAGNADLAAELARQHILKTNEELMQVVQRVLVPLLGEDL